MSTAPVTPAPAASNTQTNSPQNTQKALIKLGGGADSKGNKGQANNEKLKSVGEAASKASKSAEPSSGGGQHFSNDAPTEAPHASTGASTYLDSVPASGASNVPS